MTDNEIKKSFECCLKDICFECPLRDIPYAEDNDCILTLLRSTLDLINRQQEEIAKLEEYIDRCKSGEEYWVKCLIERPNEAVKEFSEMLKKHILSMEYRAETKIKTVSIEKVKELISWILTKVVIDTVDKTVEEMAGDTE